MDSFQADAQSLHDETVALRRDFHRHPELAFRETRTAGEIARVLRACGIEPRTGVGGTGVVAVLEGGTSGRTVLARADIDALPIQEEGDAPYASQTSGVMHACGHDGHAAVLLSVAKMLARRRDALAGRVVFVFQPAEEIVRGARAMLDDGALDGEAPDVSVGLHLSSEIPVGTVALSEGPTMAAADFFDVTVEGSGGHAAKPHLTTDPITAAAQWIQAAQLLVARETDPQDQAVLSVTSIHGGSAHNVIPPSVDLKGTVRTFEAATRERLRGRFLELAEGIGRATGATLHASWRDGTPAVVNDPTVTDQVRRIAIEQLGAARVQPATPTMGGDDMALWLEQAPGCYFFVGGRNEERGIAAPHHHPRFDLDEASLSVAASVLAAAVWTLGRG